MKTRENIILTALTICQIGNLFGELLENSLPKAIK